MRRFTAWDGVASKQNRKQVLESKIFTCYKIEKSVPALKATVQNEGDLQDGLTFKISSKRSDHTFELVVAKLQPNNRRRCGL